MLERTPQQTVRPKLRLGRVQCAGTSPAGTIRPRPPTRRVFRRPAIPGRGSQLNEGALEIVAHRLRPIKKRGAMGIRLGIASWVNPPAERAKRAPWDSHLAHYATHFNAVEINSSFYRAHRYQTYVRWSESTPPAFRFAVKCPRILTHERAMRHYRDDLREYAAAISGLGTKLAVILVQLPPSLSFERAVARRFFKSLVELRIAQIACEPRHPSWFTTAAADQMLSQLGVARVAADPPRGERGHLPGGATSLIYYRLHGSSRAYYSTYDRNFIGGLAAELTRLSRPERSLWCVFDNTAAYGAWYNAEQLQALLES